MENIQIINLQPWSKRGYFVAGVLFYNEEKDEVVVSYDDETPGLKEFSEKVLQKIGIKTGPALRIGKFLISSESEPTTVSQLTPEKSSPDH